MLRYSLYVGAQGEELHRARRPSKGTDEARGSCGSLRKQDEEEIPSQSSPSAGRQNGSLRGCRGLKEATKRVRIL